jgi:hypothetical protein
MSERLRKGMWVRCADRVGIIAALGDPDIEVHLVDADGVTQTVIVVTQSALAQSAFDDIPASRRPTADMARSLGYL